MAELFLTPKTTLSLFKLFRNTIFDNKISLAILIELGEKRKKTFNELAESLNVQVGEIISVLDFLESEGYIEQNPTKDNSKPFEERIYRLRTKGAIFLQRIREKFPEISFKFFF